MTIRRTGRAGALYRAAGFVKQHNFLMPAISAFACFIIVVLLAISIWFFTGISASMEEAVYETAGRQSAMGAETLRLTIDGYASLSGWVSELEQVTPRAYRASSYRAYQAFKEYDLPIFRFSNLMLYYGRDVRMLSVRGTSSPQVRFPSVEDYDAFLNYLDGIYEKQIFCTMDFGAGYDSNTLVVAHPLPNHALALFTMEYSDLYKLIAPGTSAADDSSVRLLADRKGHVLWSNVPFSDSQLSDLLEYEQSDIRRTYRADNRDYLYSAAAVSEGIKLITLDEVTTQFDTISRSIRVLLVLCLILLVTGVLLLVLGTKRSGAPIVQLVDSIRQTLPQQNGMPDNIMDALRQVCSQYSQLIHESRQQNALLSNDELRDLFVLRIICGQYADPEERNNLCRWLDMDFPYPCFVSCLMLFEMPPTDEQRNQIEHRLRRFSGDGFTGCFCLTPDGRSAVGMINLADTKDLRSFGETLLASLLESASVTIGLGQPYASMDALGRSYLEAHAALEQRLIRGKNTCILYSDMPSDGSENAAVYPQKLLENYTSSLRSWEPEAIQQELDQIIAFIHQNGLPLQQVKCICFELTASLLREISRMGSLTSSLDSSMFDVFSIAEYTSVNELANKIVQLSQTVQQNMEVRRTHRKDQLIEQCRLCIQQNLSNAQFSLSMLAEQFDLTPQTLRRHFKEATGQTLSSYMIELRVERAKKLLEETDLDLNHICIQCGYIDISSFARLFKNEVGVSPGTYRENCRKHF